MRITYVAGPAKSPELFSPTYKCIPLTFSSQPISLNILESDSANKILKKNFYKEKLNLIQRYAIYTISTGSSKTTPDVLVLTPL
jgi:hypothetical protein